MIAGLLESIEKPAKLKTVEKIKVFFFYRFQHFANFSMDSGSPSIMFFRTGLIYDYKAT